MSTPIVFVDVQVQITSWTSPPPGSTGTYTAQAIMVVGNNTPGVTITNGNQINIDVPASRGPVQINFNPWTALPTIFMLGAPFNEATPGGDSPNQFSSVLIDHSGLLTGNGAMQWTYNGVQYVLAAIPLNGAAVIDLNNPGDSGAGQTYAFDLTIRDSAGNWGVWDPTADNEYED